MPQATNLAFLQDLKGLMAASIENAIHRSIRGGTHLKAALTQWMTNELSFVSWQLRKPAEVSRVWAEFQNQDLRRILTSATLNFTTGVVLEYGEDRYEKLIDDIASRVASMAYCAVDDEGRAIPESAAVDMDWVDSMLIGEDDLATVYRINSWLFFLVVKDLLGIRIDDLSAMMNAMREDPTSASEGKSK
ncbi:hypothetical protein [Stenotrophomonas sp. GD03657]|uniref:hypothetical protein n=1 Tax=Stenotrophomonas sp. GD03657 TaxID=2975363 RepID=UPI00244D7768|nr:hypothetical protein [Stenotrophomonas sp. GD03657]MDH2154247.1 hypothetical protein [Stenotrophomonas sp. GD03657]